VYNKIDGNLNVKVLIMTLRDISLKYGVKESQICEFIKRPSMYFIQQVQRPGKNRTVSDVHKHYEALCIGFVAMGGNGKSKNKL